MLIKILKGNYGYNDGVSVKAKTPADAPFIVSDKEAARLCSLGIAMILDKDGITANSYEDMSGTTVPPANIPINDPSADDNNDEAMENTNEDSSEDCEDEDSEDSLPSYSEESTNVELQAIASEWGIELPNRANKAQILEILDSYFVNAPELSAEDPQI